MISKDNFWVKTFLKLKEINKVCLLVVVDSKGSSPGKKGFKMLLGPEGPLFGSIGGGKLEHDLVEKSIKTLKERPSKYAPPQLHYFQHRPDEVHASGMICTGEQHVAQIFLSLSHTLFENWEEKIKIPQTILINEKDIHFDWEADDKEAQGFTQHESGWEYREAYDDGKSIYIIGAGHVGSALSQCMKWLGFRVYLFDHRPGLSTTKNNSYFDELIIGDYDKIHEYIPDSLNAFVAIVSSSHESDELVLRTLLEKKVAYIGMMGSQSKVSKIFNKIGLDIKNNKEKRFIHAPIGLSINSMTAQEIALSIAAQIIQVKNTQDKN